MINKEGIRKVGDELVIAWDHDPADLIPIIPVHKQWTGQSDRGTVEMYTAYAFRSREEYAAKLGGDMTKDKAKELIDFARSEIKGLHKSYVIENVTKMIDAGLRKFEDNNTGKLRLNNFDLILTPQSSAPLNNLIMDRIQKLGGKFDKTLIARNGMVKKAIKDITFAVELLEREGK